MKGTMLRILLGLGIGLPCSAALGPGLVQSPYLRIFAGSSELDLELWCGGTACQYIARYTITQPTIFTIAAPQPISGCLIQHRTESVARPFARIDNGGIQAVSSDG